MSGFLLDTNVVSELVRPAPAPAVLHWVEARQAADLFLSAVTIGELVHGVARLPDGRRRRRLLRWVRRDLARQFEGRILPLDQATAEIWGELMAAVEWRGRPQPVIDAQIAATAAVRGLTLATRHVRYFGGFAEHGVSVVDPWQHG